MIIIGQTTTKSYTKEKEGDIKKKSYRNKAEFNLETYMSLKSFQIFNETLFYLF